MERKKAVREYCDEHTQRLEMQKILQLEQEYAKMTLCMRDKRFHSDHASAQGVPVGGSFDYLHSTLSHAYTRESFKFPDAAGVL